MANAFWQKIDEIFPLVADLPPEERAARLDELCGTDENLRREISAMLAVDEKAAEFIETPMMPDSLARAFSGEKRNGSDIRSENPYTLELAGRQIGAYRVVRKLGAGGMGAVYLAERADGEFRKRVAIKLVKRGADTDFNLRRFRHERQILAALEHPNIARLLDGGTNDDGSPFFVMEYVEGKPLFDFCAERNLDLRERLRLFRQILAAIAYAHEQGVVHRDIKPSNILVARDGSVRLLDFGIAKILDSDLIHDSFGQTETLLRQMTPEYASPEQICGEEITAASDVYSLGVVLYELLSGERPYKFTSRAPHEIARVICEEEVQSLKSKLQSRNDDDTRLMIHDSLEAVVLKSLRKKPAERYASVGDFDRDIRGILDGSPVSTDGRRFKSLTSASENSSAANASSAVASEKSNSTGDDLAAARATGEIQATTAEARPFGKFKARTAFAAALICVVLPVAVWSIFNFSIQKKQETPTESATIAAPPSEERKEIEKPRTKDAVADGLYLAAKQQMAARTADGLNRATELFKQAVERDPNFALAFSGLADAFMLNARYEKNPANAYQKSEEYAVKALALDPDLVEARISLAMARYRGAKASAEAERHFLRAIEINPRQPTARHWYSVVLFETGRYSEALREIQIAAEIEPQSAIIQSHLAACYTKLVRYDEALFHANRAIELESRLITPYVTKSLVLQFRGDYEAAMENYRQAHIVTGGENEPFWLILQAHAHAAGNRRAEGLAVLKRLFKTPIYQKVSLNFVLDLAIFYHLLGDDDDAFEHLKKVQVKRKSEVDALTSDPRLAKLREDSRFAELKEKWLKEVGSK